MGSQQKKKKRTKDTRSMVSEIKRAQDLDQNRLAIQPTHELGYRPAGINTIDFVNVSTSIHSSQTNAPQPPAQVTGLNVVPQAGSDTQLNLTWTASAAGDLINYNVYRSGTSGSGFGVIAQPVPNSYANTGLVSGTTYYYKVSAVGLAGEGTLSVEDSATTTGTAPIIPRNLWLKFDGNYTDSSGLGNTVNPTNVSGFVGTGKFGTNSVNLNTPTAGTDRVAVPNNTNTALDLVNGFSYSLWAYPTSYGSTSGNYIFNKFIDTNNWIALWMDGGGNLNIDVRDGGTLTSKQGIGLNLNDWQHVVLTYDGITPTIYVNTNTFMSASSVNFLPTSTDLVIGNLGGSIGANTSFRGRIDEFQYFKGLILTGTQITNLFNTNNP